MKRSSFLAALAATGLLTLSITAARSGDDAPKKPAQESASKSKKDDASVKEAKARKSEDKPDSSISGLNDARTIAFINEQIESGWKENKIQPSAVANDYEWIRRAFIDTIGRIPSVIPNSKSNPKEDPVGAKGELLYFLDRPSASRRTEVLKYLLNHEDYARNWANIWSIWLITRTTQPGIDRNNLRTWLERQFGENRRYDEIVQELLTATAEDADGSASKVNKAAAPANFLLSHFGEMVPREHRLRDGQFEMIPATSRITRLFLGIQTQCTQCHDHPFIDERKQGQFWGVNVFLRQLEREPATIQQQGNRMAIQHYKLRDNPKANQGGGVFYEQRNGLLKYSNAVWLDKNKPSLSSNSPRRLELARFVINDEYFAKSIVNRLWAHFMGQGFTSPVDDFGEHNPISHPDLLNRLAQDFITSGYDVHRLISWIMSSKPYQLTSVATVSNAKPEADRYFARMSLKALSPEELVSSIFTATNYLQIKHPDAPQARRDTQAAWLGDFSANFGDDEGNEATFNGTVVQALLLMNGNRLNEAVALSQIVKMATDSNRPLDLLYLAALSRLPSTKEREAFASATHPSAVYATIYLRDKERNKLYRDVLWALFNSNEFILNH